MSCHYIPLEKAKETLLSRRGLQPLVEAYWKQRGFDFPFQFDSQFCYAAFARQLATFRFEDAYFVLMCEKAGLTPLWFPYASDKYVTRSALKRSYVMPMCAERYGRNGGLVIKKSRPISIIENCSGKRLTEIVLDDGALLPDWHRKRLEAAYPDAQVLDESVYQTAWQNLPSTVRYELFLSLFISNMVLFEDYHGGESGDVLDSFTASVFEPAFERVRSHFGVSPLIVAVPWKQEFAYYPEGELVQNWRNVPLLNF